MMKPVILEKPPECPITHEPLVDPVIAADGITYERYAIEEWLASSDQSPCGHYTLPHKDLTINYSLRELIDPFLSKIQKDERAARDRAREEKQKPLPVLPIFQQDESAAIGELMESVLYKEDYRRLKSYYDQHPFQLTHPLSKEELSQYLRELSHIEKILSKDPNVSLVDFLDIPPDVRKIVLNKLCSIDLNVEKYQMPLKAFLQLDADRMGAFLHAVNIVTNLLDKKEYKVTWDLIFSLSTEDYLKMETFEYYGAEIVFFSNPKHTDHLSIPEILEALTKSPKEAVRTFLKVPGNVDKLFARISDAEEDAIIKAGWSYPESPGGLGELRARPDDAGGFRRAMMELSARHLKGHVVYYERTKEYLPNIIKSRDDLKKVLEWLLPHECQDVLERLRDRWGQLIKTPDDLAQLLNGLEMHPKAGLLIDFEASEFHPDVLYVGKGEERTVNYAFWPAYDQPVLRGVLSTTDVPELKDEKWLNSDHRSQFPALCIREALSHKHGIIFQNKNPAGVLQGLDAKVAEEEVSFLRSLLPNRWAFQQALRLLQPDRQEFLRQAMQPYLHLEPYQELVLPPPPTTHSNTVVRPSHAPRPIRVAPAKPYNLIIYDRQKLQDAHDELRDTLNGIHGPVQDILSRADAAQAVRVCFPTLIDFKKFMSTLSGYCSRSKKDLLYRTWREAIDENIRSIHDLFLVSQCLGDEGKALLYNNEHHKIMLENWRKAYPQVKDQYLMLLRAAVGYPGYKDEHAPCEQVSALRKVAACLMVFFWAFWTHLSPTSEAEKQIRTLATSEPNFFTSPSKRAAAIFVDGLNERVDERSSAEFLANQS